MRDALPLLFEGLFALVIIAFAVQQILAVRRDRDDPPDDDAR